MRVVWAVAVAVLSPAFISGCLGGDGGPKDTGSPEFGVIAGRVLDDEYFPIPGVMVSLRPLAWDRLRISANSSEDGVFRLDNVPAGPLVLSAEKVGYAPFETRIVLSSGETIDRNLTLIPIPGVARRIAPQTPLNGRFQCAAEWGTDGGSCDSSVPPPAPRPFNSTADPLLEVPAGWGGVLLQLRWTVSSPANVMEGMRFEVLTANGTARLAYAEGPGPDLRIQFDRDVPHSGATDNRTLGAQGGPVLLRARPMGLMNEATCAVQCLKGVGVVVELSYSVYPTFFFGSGVDPTYSALEE